MTKPQAYAAVRKLVANAGFFYRIELRTVARTKEAGYREAGFFTVLGRALKWSDLVSAVETELRSQVRWEIANGLRAKRLA